MIRVGITGGIGSGKSMICRVFSQLGVPVYYADDSARRLMEQDPQIRDHLSAMMGEDVYKGSSLNRAKMSELIFHDRDLLKKVNRLVHPRVAEDFAKWCRSFEHLPYVIQESALLLENTIYRRFDYIILVLAPKAVRFARVINRKGMTAEKLRSVMNNQKEPESIEGLHLKLNNDGKSLLLPMILDFHKKLSQLK